MHETNTQLMKWIQKMDLEEMDSKDGFGIYTRIISLQGEV